MKRTIFNNMDLKSFTQAIQQIADEKGIPKDKILETIEVALAAAYKRDYGKRGQIVRANIDPDTGKVRVRQIKIVVDETMIKSEEEIAAEEVWRLAGSGPMVELVGPTAKQNQPDETKEGPKEEKSLNEDKKDVEAIEPSPVVEEVPESEKKVRFNEEKHIMLAEAQKIKPDIKAGDELEFPLEDHEEYGRIAAQTAKQVIIQRIREAEREAVFDEYKNKEGELVSGLVQRIEGRNIFIDIGRTVGVLPSDEQIPYERYRVGERLKVLVSAVERNPKGPSVFLSRSNPKLLRALFEIEVPEIASGVVEIKAIAREPGSRTKVAVMSHEGAIDPVGSLVGQKGVRVSTVINELGGEKIDVVEWSQEVVEYVAHSLSPAKVLDVEVNERRKEARVTVPDDQLSLAIGKGGQNVRLAAKLTGWKIDVRSDHPRSMTSEEPTKESESAGEIAPFKEGGPSQDVGAAPEKDSTPILIVDDKTEAGTKQTNDDKEKPRKKRMKK